MSFSESEFDAALVATGAISEDAMKAHREGRRQMAPKYERQREEARAALAEQAREQEQSDRRNGIVRMDLNGHQVIVHRVGPTSLEHVAHAVEQANLFANAYNEADPDDPGYEALEQAATGAYQYAAQAIALGESRGLFDDANHEVVAAFENAIDHLGLDDFLTEARYEVPEVQERAAEQNKAGALEALQEGLALVEREQGPEVAAYVRQELANDEQLVVKAQHGILTADQISQHVTLAGELAREVSKVGEVLEREDAFDDELARLSVPAGANPEDIHAVREHFAEITASQAGDFFSAEDALHRARARAGIDPSYRTAGQRRMDDLVEDGIDWRIEQDETPEHLSPERVAARNEAFRESEIERLTEQGVLPEG